jgi:O-antigen/teichoic acid export membrane protein
VFFSVLTQVWSALASPLTILIISWHLTGVEQGFYYTFNSVLALQVFVELGLVTVIVQVASHEWAFLRQDASGAITGNARALSRLSSLLRFALKWYTASALLVAIGLSVGGWIFFSAKPHSEVVWQLPWFLLCGVAGLALMMSPFFSVIEGCNRVASIYSFRLIQGVANSLTIILGIMGGLGLYALPLAALVRLLAGITFLAWKHRRFIRQLLTGVVTERIAWLGEVWPFQWRIGISWMSGYFIFSVFTPVMFYYHGPKVAGQMGMTWALVASIESLSSPWITSRIPQFGVLISRREYTELDRLFRRLLLITLSIAGAGSIGLVGLIYGIHFSGIALSNRLLPMLPAVIFIAQRPLNILISAFAVYTRSHKQEPMMIPSLISAILVGSASWLLGAAYGPLGAATGFLVITILWGVPSSYHVFQQCRQNHV